MITGMLILLLLFWIFLSAVQKSLRRSKYYEELHREREIQEALDEEYYKKRKRRKKREQDEFFRNRNKQDYWDEGEYDNRSRSRHNAKSKHHSSKYKY